VDLRRELEDLEAWRGRLRPFLAKTVTLAESASDHSSDSQPHVMGDTLLISHVAEGNRPLPMQNLPVVTFLDRQRANIYREASMARCNSPDKPGKPAENPFRRFHVAFSLLGA